jgi:endonuclease III
VKSPTGAARNLKAILKRAVKSTDLPGPADDDPVAVLVMSFLLWESTTEKAARAYRRLVEETVDFNDLRVSMPQETADLIGERYPLVMDRAQRLRAVLRDIYLREHGVSLDGLRKTTKRDVKQYIETLDGIVPYVASRVLLLSFDTHAVPVDEQLRERLVQESVVEETMTLPDLTAWLGRQIRAGDGVAAHQALQAWVESKAGGRSGRVRSKTAGTHRGSTSGKGKRAGGTSSSTKRSAGRSSAPARKTARRSRSV